MQLKNKLPVLNLKGQIETGGTLRDKVSIVSAEFSLFQILDKIFEKSLPMKVLELLNIPKHQINFFGQNGQFSLLSLFSQRS